MYRLLNALERINAEIISGYYDATDKFEYCCTFLQVETYAPYARAWVESMEMHIQEMEALEQD